MQPLLAHASLASDFLACIVVRGRQGVLGWLHRDVLAESNDEVVPDCNLLHLLALQSLDFRWRNSRVVVAVAKLAVFIVAP